MFKHSLRLISLCFLIQNPLCIFSQIQLGETIYCKSSSSINCGAGVSMSSDGTELLVSDVGETNFPGSRTSYEVQLYRFDNNDWVSGYDFSVDKDVISLAMDISGDASIIAIGAWEVIDQDLINSSLIVIYEKSNETWNKSNQEFFAKRNHLNPNLDISIDFKGETIMVGNSGHSAFHPAPYRNDIISLTKLGSSWNKQEKRFVDNGIGRNISLSNDGSLLLSSGLCTDCWLYPYEVGNVVLFNNYSGTITESVNIIGSVNNFGVMTELSEDGKTIAVVQKISLSMNSNYYRDPYEIIIYFNDNGNWNQKGNPIIGFVDHFITRNGIDLSSDGNRIAIGSFNIHEGIHPSQARLFEFINNDWELVGEPIIGLNLDNDFTGAAISLSDDGKILAVGEPRRNGRGQVRVFEYPTTSTNSLFVPDNKSICFPNPVFDQLFISDSINYAYYNVIDATGQLIKNGAYQESIDVSQFESGLYILFLYSGSRVFTTKFVKF